MMQHSLAELNPSLDYRFNRSRDIPAVEIIRRKRGIRNFAIIRNVEPALIALSILLFTASPLAFKRHANGFRDTGTLVLGLDYFAARRGHICIDHLINVVEKHEQYTPYTQHIRHQ